MWVGLIQSIVKTGEAQCKKKKRASRLLQRNPAEFPTTVIQTASSSMAVRQPAPQISALPAPTIT